MIRSATQGVSKLLACVGLLSLAACANRPIKAPDVLAVPAGQVMVIEALGAGTQNYLCQKADKGPHWVGVGPEADLFDDGGVRVAHHGPGSRWIMADGSQIEGSVSASLPATKEGDLPWLLLSAHDASGAGKLARVQWIQRLNTHGGMMPGADGCQAGNAGKTAKVSYTATYRFFAPQP